jgi:hypothetical protein
MAKSKIPKTTPEDEARHAENLRKLRARIAEREAQERQMEQMRARAAESWVYRIRLRVARFVAP